MVWQEKRRSCSQEELEHLHDDDEYLHHEEEELPSPEHTQNVLAKFRSMESVEMDRERDRYEMSPQHAAPLSPHHQYTHDEPLQNGHYDHEHHHQEDEYDSYDERDVTRESDQAPEEELPEHGTTRNLLARYQSLVAGN